MKDETVIEDSIHAEGSVRLNEKGFTGFSVVARTHALGDIDLFEILRGEKNILAPGAIKVLKYLKLGFPPARAT
jgi:hypothetical protein